MMTVDADGGCPLCSGVVVAGRLASPLGTMVWCRACGLLYRGSRQPEDGAPCDAAFALEERIGKRRRPHFQRFLARAGRPGKLLDVGCGYGFFLQLAREAGWDAVGVDVDRRAVEYARSQLHVDARAGDIRDLRFPDGSFDVVTLWNVLELVPQPLPLLHEVRRTLVPGGRVFVRTQNAAWHRVNFALTRFLRHVGGRAIFDKHPYLTYFFGLNSFSRSTLRHALERAGFPRIRIDNSRPIRGDPYAGTRPPVEFFLGLTKHVVHGTVQTIAVASAGQWLLGPSIEAWGGR